VLTPRDRDQASHRVNVLTPPRDRALDVLIWVLAVAAIGATLWFSLGSGAGDEIFGSDKLGHAVAYCVDTFLLLLAVVWRPGRARSSGIGVAPIAVGMLALGGLIELVQGVVHRDADLLDWLSNAAGVGVAVVVFSLWRAAAERVRT
jgi:hypothetical protein